MSNHIEKLGDKTSRRVVPDFEGAKYHHWSHMKRMAERAGTIDTLPRKPRQGLAETSFFAQVDRRTSRVSFGVGVAFDVNGRIIREEAK